MKLHILIILIILTALAQASVFYSGAGNITINLIAIVGWVLYFTGVKKDTAFFVFFAGILVDLIRLSGIGVTSLSILLPFAIFLFIENLFELKGTFLSYILSLIMLILSSFILLGLSVLFNNIVIEDFSIVQNLLLSAGLNWGIIMMCLFFKAAFVAERTSVFASK